jgi:hypothetical protein
MFLLIAVLGSDEKGRAPNQLIVTLVYHSLRTVPVKEIDGQEQRRRQKLECGMGFYQEIEKIRTHKPLDLCLNIDGFDIREGGSL